MRARDVRVTYVLSRFPCRSEQFVLREIEGLERLGLKVRVLTMGHRTGDDMLQEIPAVELRRRPPWWRDARPSDRAARRRCRRAKRAPCQRHRGRPPCRRR